MSNYNAKFDICQAKDSSDKSPKDTEQTFQNKQTVI